MQDNPSKNVVNVPTKDSIFAYTDFRKYLSHRFSPRGDSRGMRVQLAQMLRTRPSYVSKILSGDIQLSLEHVPVINRLLEHTSDESEYLMQLVLYTQAGSKELETYFKEKLDCILENRRNLAGWIEKKESLFDDVLARYATQWHHTVIHALISIPEFQTKNALVERMNLKASTVSSSLLFLVQSGLVDVKNDRYIPSTKNRIHLMKGSPWTAAYHGKIRERVSQSLMDPDPEDRHYSLVMAVSLREWEIIKNKFQAFVEEIENGLGEDTGEEVNIVALDFFKA